VTGTTLVISGRVVRTSCRPVGRALIDVWQCDESGDYDNDGYRLRGHQLTDAQGRWRLTTVVPGLYAGRTRHIHVKVQRPGAPVLTTQLYFPGERANRTDGFFDRELLLRRLRKAPGRWTAQFDFVLA
jgi:protocatechuate 3,4-dioxygenase beta subunit